MAFTPASPVTGSPQASFTAPTYTLVADQPPANNGKQWYVSALGGTQAGVAIHSVGTPFTVAFFRPPVLQSLGPVNPVTGVVKSVPMNNYSLIVRKGVIPLAGQAPKLCTVKVQVQVPAGSETADLPGVRAALSLAFGTLWEQSSGIGLTVYNGAI